MTNNSKLQDKLNTKFDLNQLGNISFGKLEGERDPMLEECFFPTYSVRKYLANPINYVLSPKGAGKSALFRTIEKRYIPEIYFDFDKYSIITINEAFGFNDEYLSIEKFTERSRMKLTISWGLYLLSKIILDIKTNHSTKPNYNDFINKISKIKEFKDKFNLYGLNDLINKIKATISFVANGQEFEISPTIKIQQEKKKIILNDLFKLANKFYEENDLTALILIDRIDNFVQKEQYSLQKKYIQGLFDSIEEISILSNITPTLFLRTDLFYSYDSDIELDKVKDRTIELTWNKGETLNFLMYRFNNNDYIFNTFNPFLQYFIRKEKNVKIKKQKSPNYLIKKIKEIFYPTSKNITLKEKQAYNYRVSEKYLTMFFPKVIDNIDGSHNNLFDWIFKYLKDANDFVNPRLLIDFFNQLIDFEKYHLEQFCYENENIDYVPPSIDNDNNIFYENLIHQNSFVQTYSKIQNDSLKNILILIKTKDFQTLFKEINSISYHRSFFRYGDINMNKFDMKKGTLNNLIKYLKLLGFCKEIEKQKFYIPLLYQKKIETM